MEPEEYSTYVAYQIENWRFIPSQNKLITDETVTLLEPRLVKMLRLLCQADGQTVSRDQIMEEVWGDVIVSDISVTRAVSDLRKALMDDTRQPKIIATVRKVGYRLLPEVTCQVPQKPPLVGTVAPPAEQKSPDVVLHRIKVSGHASRTTPLLILLLCLVSLLFLVFRSPQSRGFERKWQMEPVAVSNDHEWAATLSKSGDHVAYIRQNLAKKCFQIWVWHRMDQSKTLVWESQDLIALVEWALNDQYLVICVDRGDNLEILKVFPVANAVAAKFASLPAGPTLGMTLLNDESLLLSVGEKQAKYPLWKVDLNSGECRPFLNLPENQSGYVYPKASPDGSQVAFVIADDIFSHDLGISNEDGTDFKSYYLPHRVYDLDWVSDHEVGLLSMIAHKPKLFIYDLRTQKISLQSLDVGTYPFSFDFSKSFVTDQALIDLDVTRLKLGYEPQKITDSAINEHDLHWIPKGNTVAYLTHIDDKINIALMQNGVQEIITYRPGVQPSNPRLSRDARTLAFIDEQSESDKVVFYDIASKKFRTVFSHPEIGTLSEFAEDNASFFVNVKDEDFHGVLEVSIQGEVLRKFPLAYKLIERNGTIYFNQMDETYLWRCNQDSQEKVMEMPPLVGISWDIWENELFTLDRSGQLKLFDYQAGTLRDMTQVFESLGTYGNLCAAGDQTVYVSLSKDFQSDVYVGRFLQ